MVETKEYTLLSAKIAMMSNMDLSDIKTLPILKGVLGELDEELSEIRKLSRQPKRN